MRNELIYAQPVKHGLHRRMTKDLGYIKNFYSVDSLRQARKRFTRAAGRGNKVLYSDGCAAIKRWYARLTS